MKYDKETLRKTALDVKAAVEEAARAQHAKEVEKYKQKMAQWHEVGKPAAAHALQEALRKVKKDQYWEVGRNMQPPSEPGQANCCTPQTKEIDGLVELLDTLVDDQITSTQLRDAGFKDVARTLRRPC